MEEFIDIVLLGFLVLTALAAVRIRDLFAVVMLFSIYSFLTAGLFMDLDAVDVAFTEAAVGAGVTVVLMLSTLGLTSRCELQPKSKSALAFLVVLVTGAALIYGTLDAPRLGDPDAPAHEHVADYYLERTGEEIGISNVVTAVLASYRSYDTMGETIVIFTAGLAVMMLLGFSGNGNSERTERASFGDIMVLRVMVKLLMPFILLYALYVQLHGETGAGGGFQAGVIFATGFVLYSLLFGEANARGVLPPSVLCRLASLGVLIYIGVAFAGILQGRNALDYNGFSDTPVQGQHLGILLVEVGVGITVFAVILGIFYTLSGRNRA